MDTEQKTQVPPQQIVSKLSRLASLLGDIQRLAEEYREVYYTKIELKVKGTNMNETLTVECDGYKVTFSLNDVYMYIESRHNGISGRAILRNGEGHIGDILTVPVQCWDKLIGALEDLIRRKLDEIAYMRNLYYTYIHTA